MANRAFAGRVERLDNAPTGACRQPVYRAIAANRVDDFVGCLHSINGADADDHLTDEIYYAVGADMSLVELGENTETPDQPLCPVRKRRRRPVTKTTTFSIPAGCRAFGRARRARCGAGS